MSDTSKRLLLVLLSDAKICHCRNSLYLAARLQTIRIRSVVRSHASPGRALLERTKTVLDQGNQPIGKVEIHAFHAAQSASQCLDPGSTRRFVGHFAEVGLQGDEPVCQQATQAL